MIIPPNSIIVSCQAREDNPLHGPTLMAAMALAAEQGGAAGLRANGPRDVAAIRAVTKLPIIGILKRETEGFPVSITPSFRDAETVAQAGADIIAIDATGRARNGEALAELISLIQRKLGLSVMADVATLAEGQSAAALGADIVATTLSGYTEETAASKGDGPDFLVLERLVQSIKKPVIAEGRFWIPAHVTEAFWLGAHAVVIGTAITNPREITRRFISHKA